LQQLRAVVGYYERYRFLIHDRACIFSGQLDESIRALGVRVLKSAPHSAKMNAVCERVIGTIRRECLDWLIPVSEAHLRTTLRPWVQHYNRGPIWGWVREFPIPRSSRMPDRLRAIAAENPMLCAPIRSSEDSITSTHWLLQNPFSGSDSNFCGSQASETIDSHSPALHTSNHTTDVAVAATVNRYVSTSVSRVSRSTVEFVGEFGRNAWLPGVEAKRMVQSTACFKQRTLEVFL
jgi:Integrase core domain